MEAGQHWRGGKRWSVVLVGFTGAGVLLALYYIFNLGTLTGVTIIENSYLYLLLLIFFSPVFILVPATKAAPRHRVPWYDVSLFLLSIGVASYFAWHGPVIGMHGWEFTAPPVPTAFACLLWLLILEGGRRIGGRWFFIFALVGGSYPIYAGYMPEIISGFSLTFTDTARYHAMGPESIIGIPTRVVGTLFFGFIVMGVALVVTGGGRFFLNLALALCGSFRGGPAKVAIIGSGFFGSMSGSILSNVMATGTMTIPAMKKIGYPPHLAGAIEACASVGGVLMPPIMGAVAFVMASFLGIPYWQIALAAAIPSILYYFGLFMQIDSYAARATIKGMPKAELPSVWQTLKEGWFYIAAFIVLLWLLLYLKYEAQAPFYATALLLLLANMRKETRMGWSRFLDFVRFVGSRLVELTALLAAIGPIIGGLAVTGMAITLSGDLVRVAGGNIYLLLGMGAITALILGLGLPITACYVFLAIVLAPTFVALGFNILAVHMFIMYWGVLSDITPPVCLSAFVAASIAGAGPMRTGFEAMRLGCILYLLPFCFLLNPVLVLQGVTLVDFLTSFSLAVVGIIFIAAGLQGYLVGVGRLGDGVVGWLTRIPLIVGGTLLAWPGMWLTVVGALLCASVALGYLIINRRARSLLIS